MARRDNGLKFTALLGSDFLAGARDTFPLIVGAIPFGLIFGMLAQRSGLSFAGTLAMSAFVFAGSAQFIALGLIAAGTAWPIVVLTTWLVNLRHVLYSATLAPYVCRLPQRWQLPLAFWLTDETFAVVIKRYTDQGDAPHNHGYYLGSALSMYLNWQCSTFLGLIGGQMLPHATEWGLDFAMPVTFIGMLIPSLKSRAMWTTVTVAGLVSLMAFWMPHKLGLMVAALAGIGAGLIVEQGQENG